MKKIYLFILLLFSSISVFSQKQKEAEALVKDGVKMYDKGDYAGALSKYEQALKLDENNFLAMAEKAMTLCATQKFTESIELCKIIFKIHADHELLNNVYLTWGKAESGLNNHDAAIRVYNEGIAKYPKYSILYFNKGVVLTTLKNYPDALLELEKSAMLNPTHIATHNAIGRIQYGRNKIVSIMALLRFLALDPLSERAKSNLEIIKELMASSNVEKNGKKGVTIKFDAGMFSDTTADGSNKPNNFSSVEMILTLQDVLITIDKKNKKKTEVKLIEEKLTTLCESLSQNQEKNSGFYWEYYAPYFISMYSSKQIETFSYIVFASTGEKYVKKWIDNNSEKIKEFYKWSEKIEWYSNLN